jgi:hypothetical protein
MGQLRAVNLYRVPTEGTPTISNTQEGEPPEPEPEPSPPSSPESEPSPSPPSSSSSSSSETILGSSKYVVSPGCTLALTATPPVATDVYSRTF